MCLGRCIYKELKAVLVTMLFGWEIGQRSILVTLDKDFAELAIVHDTPHSGILRIVNFPA